MFENLVDYNDRNNAPLSNEKLRQAISKVMAETEAEERNVILDANSVAMDTFCQSPVTTNTQGENLNAILTSEGINISDAFRKNYAEGDAASNPKVATHTSYRKKIKLLTLAT